MSIGAVVSRAADFGQSVVVEAFYITAAAGLLMPPIVSEDKHRCRRSVADVGRYKIIIIRVYYYIIIIVVVVVIESASLHTAASAART